MKENYKFAGIITISVKTLHLANELENKTRFVV